MQAVHDKSSHLCIVMSAFLSDTLKLCSWLYWSAYYRIERASMDGTSREVLHSTNLYSAFGLTLDYTSQTLYWADYDLDRLESSNADGTNRVLLSTTNIVSPYYMTFFAGTILHLCDGS